MTQNALENFSCGRRNGFVFLTKYLQPPKNRMIEQSHSVFERMHARNGIFVSILCCSTFTSRAMLQPQSYVFLVEFFACKLCANIHRTPCENMSVNRKCPARPCLHNSHSTDGGAFHMNRTNDIT